MPCKYNSCLIIIQAIIMKETSKGDTYYKESTVLLNISMASNQYIRSLTGQNI